jgi:hypothetical protein
VARALGDHREEKEAKLAVVEKPAAPASAVMPVMFAMVRMTGEIIGRGMMAGAIPGSSFHELKSSAVSAVTPAVFAVVVTAGEKIGWGEMMAEAISVSLFHELRYKSRYI